MTKRKRKPLRNGRRTSFTGLFTEATGIKGKKRKKLMEAERSLRPKRKKKRRRKRKGYFGRYFK